MLGLVRWQRIYDVDTESYVDVMHTLDSSQMICVALTFPFCVMC